MLPFNDFSTSPKRPSSLEARVLKSVHRATARDALTHGGHRWNVKIDVLDCSRPLARKIRGCGVANRRDAASKFEGNGDRVSGELWPRSTSDDAGRVTSDNWRMPVRLDPRSRLQRCVMCRETSEADRFFDIGAHVDPTEKSLICADGLTTAHHGATGFMGVRRVSIYRWMASGELPFVELDSGRRIPRRALVEFAERRLVRR